MPPLTTAASGETTLAPGMIVVVRDEQWLVSDVQQTADGDLLTVRGVSELVEGTTAQFYTSIDTVELQDPRQTTVVEDSSSHYVKSRLWLESTLRKTSLPLSDSRPLMSSQALADQLGYQREAVAKALEPDRLRTRLLIADAVGLGKTLEIGMILAELIRRGRGRRILIVTPRHVLEQMQHELWTRFAIPFVRLDSEGVQQVKQKLPATRNPFTFFDKVIISIDTLKQDRFIHDLRQHHWDAVVIDESHNVTNQSTQNNQLARILAPNTDSLLLASATPHNGRNESFAQQLSLLEPTSVGPDGTISPDAVRHLMIRRHRYSDSVKNEVGDMWAERLPPRNIAVTPSPEEHAVAQEIAATWTHPQGTPPITGKGARLFPWTLAKAFLSSPIALEETLAARLASLSDSPETLPERRALERLRELNTACLAADDAPAPTSPHPLPNVNSSATDSSPNSGKYRELVRQLQDKGVSARSDKRVVVFAERVATLGWLRTHLRKDLRLKAENIRVLHGGLTDIEQQEIVESFKQASSPIRVLITGDVASEGVNLHKQCHELIHFDIPWSLIRIEQRNGRIDRYGQEFPPQITTLLLNLEDIDGFTGDIRVLTRLVEREREAHEKLGDAASLMGEYSGKAEEDAIRDVLRGAKDFDATVRRPEDITATQPDGPDWLALLTAANAHDPAESPEGSEPLDNTTTASIDSGLFTSDVDYLLAGLTELYGEPGRDPEHGGVSLRIEYTNTQRVQVVSFQPSADLRQRLIALPQSYLEQRRVLERLQLTPDRATAESRLAAALNDAKGSSWPDTHYLSPLHPVLDWLADRSLAHLGRNEIYAIHGTVEHPTVVVQGIVTNQRGQNIAVTHLTVQFMGPIPLPETHNSPGDMFQSLGLNSDTVGIPVSDAATYQELIAPAVEHARAWVDQQVKQAAHQDAERRVDAWLEQMDRWEADAHHAGKQTQLVQLSRVAVEAEKRLATEMLPDRTHVRPLLVVVPRPTAATPADTPTTPRGSSPEPGTSTGGQPTDHHPAERI